MEKIRTDQEIQDVRGRLLGRVKVVHPCCIEADTGIAVQPEAIFGITAFAVELVCDADQLTRYACGMHAPNRRSSVKA